MSFPEVLLIALGLAMDAFAVCLGAGTTRFVDGPRPVFRLAFHFGLFQALMPILGWASGALIARYISAWDHWVAFGLLAFVGGRMVRSGFEAEGECHATDPSRGGTLIMLAIATSIDAFAVGLTLAMRTTSSAGAWRISSGRRRPPTICSMLRCSRSSSNCFFT